MYKYYNANVLGNVENDCTIRAISCATNKSWDQVYEQLSDLAQAQGTMMDSSKFIIDYLDMKYKRLRTNGTVGQVSDRYKDNIVLITMKNHITCSKYGTIYDLFDPRKNQAEYCWLVS